MTNSANTIESNQLPNIPESIEISYRVTPKEITEDCDTGDNVAHFSYYDGVIYAKENNLKQSGDYRDLLKGTHFIVSCGDVMVKVLPKDYPTIERRIF